MPRESCGALFGSQPEFHNGILITLITLVNDRLTLVTGTGENGFTLAESAQSPSPTVRIFQLAAP